MVSALVMINVARGQVQQVGQALAQLPGISEVFSVGGRFDLVAIIRVPDNEALAELVTTELASNEAIENTETLIAFRVHSRHDLESMFSIGLE
jgi:DNA-binding Lrp family transcriptional regulator